MVKEKKIEDVLTEEDDEEYEEEEEEEETEIEMDEEETPGIEFIDPSKVAPSTIIRGDAEPLRVPTPRITIPGPEPG